MFSSFFITSSISSFFNSLSSFLTSYLVLFIFLLVSFFLSSILFLLSYLVGTSVKLLDREKLSSYECGFLSLKDSRDLFTVQFYRLSVLFILFDVEIIFLIPWLLSLKRFANVDSTFWFGGLLFLLPLVIAFIYEFVIKALDIS